MRKTTQSAVTDESITINTDGLMQLLGCGKATATQIGTAAQAKIQIGKRVLWHVPSVRKYVEGLAGHTDRTEVDT